MEAKNVRQTFTEAKDQQASHSSYLLRQTAIAKKWLLILELKISLMSVDFIRGQKKKSKGPVGYLGAINEVANFRLRFRDFKPKNTLRWMHLKVENNK